MALAMAVTALIVLAGSPSDVSASVMEAEWSTGYAEPQRVALAQRMMAGNVFTKLQEEGGEEEPPAEEEAPAEERRRLLKRRRLLRVPPL